MIFGGLQKISTIDFPKRLSAVVFTLGCDIDCFYCHNRILIENGNPIGESEVKNFLEKRKGLLDGIVVSGGEPTLQKDLVEFFKYLKSLGYDTKLDSNGQHPEVIKKLCEMKLVDYIAIDLKATEKNYKNICGDRAEFEKTISTIKYLNEIKMDFEVRTTLCPGIDEKDLLEILSSVETIPRWRLNFFRMPENYKSSDEERLKGRALKEKDLEIISEEIKKRQPNLIY